MSTADDDDVKEALRRLCAGLPVSPLPPPRRRDETLPHAPTRVAALNAQQQKVRRCFLPSQVHSHVVTVMVLMAAAVVGYGALILRWFMLSVNEQIIPR